MIRLATPIDAAQIQAIYAPYVLNTPISFENEPPGVDEMAERIRSVLVKFPWIVFEDDGFIAGYAYASTLASRPAYQWSVESSVYTRSDLRRKGLGRKLYATLFDLLRIQGLYNVMAGIALPNAESVGFHESMGFRKAGERTNIGFKLGRWHSVGQWQLQLAPYAESPVPPLALPQAQSTAAWQDALTGRSQLGCT